MKNTVFFLITFLFANIQFAQIYDWVHLTGDVSSDYANAVTNN